MDERLSGCSPFIRVPRRQIANDIWAVERTAAMICVRQVRRNEGRGEVPLSSPHQA